MTVSKQPLKEKEKKSNKIWVEMIRDYLNQIVIRPTLFKDSGS